MSQAGKAVTNLGKSSSNTADSGGHLHGCITIRRSPANAEAQGSRRHGAAHAGECRIGAVARGRGTNGDARNFGDRRVQRPVMHHRNSPRRSIQKSGFWLPTNATTTTRGSVT